MGGCCIGNCCVMDNPVGDFFRNIFSCSEGCGYHPGPSKDELHAKKIADELAAMKETTRKSTEKKESELIDYINSSMNNLLDELETLNEQDFGGRSLNLNIGGIKAKNDMLKSQVKGHIGRALDERLVLTDRELSIILEEKDDKKRGKRFDEFVVRVKQNAVKSLRVTIERTVDQQKQLIQSEIEARLNEINSSLDRIEHEYTDALNNRSQGGTTSEKKQLECIYKTELLELLLEQVK